MTAAVVHLLAVQGESTGRDLPLPPWAIGLGAFVLLCVLLAITFDLVLVGAQRRLTPWAKTRAA